MDLLTIPMPALFGIGVIVMAILAALVFKRTSSNKSSPVQKQDAVKTNGKAPTITENKDHFPILFGTQTGTAERFSKSLKAQLESKFGAQATFDVLDMENYDAPSRLPKERLVFLLLATYGDGEPTDNATEFYNWLVQQTEQENENSNLLSGVTFAVFGLGNRQYEHFCAVGKRVHKMIEQLGGKALVQPGEGDDDRDIDEDFDGWSVDLFSALDKSPLVTENKNAGKGLTADQIPAYTIRQIADAPKSAVNVIRSGNGQHHATPYLATITCVRELHTKQSDRSCVHVEVDISGSDVTYEAGDHIGVFAENSAANVEAAAKALGQPLDAVFKLELPAGNPNMLPEPFEGVVTLRHALARHVDLLNAPSKGALGALAAFAKDPKEAAHLRELASIEGRDAFHSYIVVAKRSLLEVLQEHPSAKPPLGVFFASVAPHLQPRFYSIASSPAQHPRSVHITCAVVKETMPSGRIHEGVASFWLARSKPGQQIEVFVRHSTFKLPTDTKTPVIMVGPGTGLAPFRGFIQERAALVKSGKTLGPGHLFFGCRNRSHDYIYGDELETAVDDKALSALHVAFSRQGPSKDYVQHHMEAKAAEVWSLLDPKTGNGYLYVCGDAKNMAKDVHRTLHSIVIKATGCNGNKAEEVVKSFSDSGRYLKDVW